MPAPKYTRDQTQTAADLRERGWSCDRIAAKLDMTRGAVAYHCLRQGADVPPSQRTKTPNNTVKRMRRGNHVVRRFTPDEDAKIVDMACRGIGPSAIGRVIGRPHNSIKGRLMTLARNQERAEHA